MLCCRCEYAISKKINIDFVAPRDPCQAALLSNAAPCWRGSCPTRLCDGFRKEEGREGGGGTDGGGGYCFGGAFRCRARERAKSGSRPVPLPTVCPCVRACVLPQKSAIYRATCCTQQHFKNLELVNRVSLLLLLLVLLRFLFNSSEEIVLGCHLRYMLKQKYQNSSLDQAIPGDFGRKIRRCPRLEKKTRSFVLSRSAKPTLPVYYIEGGFWCFLTRRGYCALPVWRRVRMLLFFCLFGVFLITAHEGGAFLFCKLSSPESCRNQDLRCAKNTLMAIYGK